MTKLSSNNVIKGDKYRFTLLTKSLVRMEYSEEGYFVDDPTQVVVNRVFPEFEFEMEETDNSIDIYTDSFHLSYNKKVFSSQGLTVTMKSNFSDYNNKWFYGEQISTLKGTTRTLDNIDGETVLDEGIISRNGYAVLDDSNSFIVSSEDEPKSRESIYEDLYFFGYQHEYKQAIKDFFSLTGPTPILPRYALGNWWSRFWAYTDEEYLELMDKFKAEEVPLAISVLDMDWHVRDVPKRFGSGWTGYSWNRELFPEPEKFIAALHDRGLKVTLNVHPADGIRACEDCYKEVADRLKLNVLLEEPAVFDMTNKEFVDSYFEDVHHPLEQQGVDFWWIDWQQGNQSKEDGLDPLWLLNQYHFEDISKSSEGLILSRYAGPGSHRYPVGFSGDSIISWESLQFQPYFTATASNIGYAWWSHDIGGHMRGYRDDELTLRWIQLGTFSPINRLHSSSSPFNGKEPWNFPLHFQNAMKTSLRERHMLIPYLYSANVEVSEKGIPLIQPMYYEYPDKDQSYEYKNQYIFGSELMVIPVVHKADEIYKFSKEDVWLPEGKWFDFHNGKRYEGNVELTIFRKVEETAIFARAGSIIPVDADIKSTSPSELPENIEWKVFPGKTNSFELTEELEGKRCITTFKMDWGKQVFTIQKEGDTSILPKDRKHFVKLFCVENVDGTKLPANVFVAAIDKELQFVVRELQKQSMDEMTFERINLPNISYDLKNQLWENLNSMKEFTQKALYVKKFKDNMLNDLLFESFYIEES